MRSLFTANSHHWPLLGQFFVAGAGLAGATLAARILGPELYGNYFLGLTIVSVVGIATDLCVGQAILTRSPGYAEMWQQWRKLGVLLTASAACLTLFSAIYLSVNGDQVLMWLVLCAGVPISFMSMVPRAFLVLDGQLRYVAVIDVASVISANLFMLALVVSYRTLAAAAAGQLIIALVRWIGLELRYTKPDSETLQKKQENLRTALNSLWASTAGIYQSQLSGFISRNGDNLIISMVLGPFNLAQYSRAYSFLLGPLQQAQMALTPMTLRDLTNAGLRGVPVREGMQSAKHLLALMLPLAGTMAVAGENMVSLLLGPDWDSAGALMASSAGLAISMTVALPARWILIVKRSRSKLRVDSLLQYSLLVGVLAGSLLWGLPGSMAVNALLVGPATAVIEWMLLPRVYRSQFLKVILPWTAALTVAPAALTFSITLINLEEITFVTMVLLITACTTVFALIVQRRA